MLRINSCPCARLLKAINCHNMTSLMPVNTALRNVIAVTPFTFVCKCTVNAHVRARSFAINKYTSCEVISKSYSVLPECYVRYDANCVWSVVGRVGRNGGYKDLFGRYFIINV